MKPNSHGAREQSGAALNVQPLVAGYARKVVDAAVVREAVGEYSARARSAIRKAGFSLLTRTECPLPLQQGQMLLWPTEEEVPVALPGVVTPLEPKAHRSFHSHPVTARGSVHLRTIRLDDAEPILPEGSMILQGDAQHVLGRLPAKTFQCIVTSPPYWGLRDYDIAGQIGLENSLEQYVNRLVSVFREARRLLKDDGILWLNIGDGYTSGNRGWRAPDRKNPARAMNVRPDTPEGLKPKDLLGVPWRLAFALQRDGWYLRCDIVWNKPNAMPESVKDRPTRAHEYIFMLTKSERYFYDSHAAMEQSGGKSRNRRSVWDVNTQPFADAHFATFPPSLIRPCIMAGSRTGDFVLDPFLGSGTVGVVSQELDRNFVGVELNPQYTAIAARRIGQAAPLIGGRP